MPLLIVVPHSDDEILQTGSLLLKYKEPITILFTAVGDFLSDKEDIEDTKMRDEANALIAKRRSEKGLYPATYVTNFYRHTADKEKQDFIDAHVMSGIYSSFVFSEPSSHISHEKCYKMCLASLRHIAVTGIHTVMTASYPVDAMGVAPIARRANYFDTLCKEDYLLLLHILKKTYRQKAKKGRLSSAETFKNYLVYNGNKVDRQWSMPYTILRKVED